MGAGELWAPPVGAPITLGPPTCGAEETEPLGVSHAGSAGRHGPQGEDERKPLWGLSLSLPPPIASSWSRLEGLVQVSSGLRGSRPGDVVVRTLLLPE